MLATTLHPENIKAELRKRHRTVGAFATAKGFKPQAVADWLRGRPNAAVEAAVEAELQDAGIDHEASQSINLDNSVTNSAAHRLNEEAR